MTGTPFQNRRPRVEERRRDDVTGTLLQNRRACVEERRRNDVTGTLLSASTHSCLFKDRIGPSAQSETLCSQPLVNTSRHDNQLLTFVDCNDDGRPGNGRWKCRC